ncbi:unnamed protein product [Rotaria socialis]|uniref:Exostosin GT47 domain-containing protein n=1 Tax=Rotaria socialis TaxID=392032 RepID=A0A818RJ20_9BILA|nr:unnamed protein product [Rotaria socialis]CAF4487497.1 unnamed protein product [Rotaria socialis]
MAGGRCGNVALLNVFKRRQIYAFFTMIVFVCWYFEGIIINRTKINYIQKKQQFIDSKYHRKCLKVQLHSGQQKSCIGPVTSEIAKSTIAIRKKNNCENLLVSRASQFWSDSFEMNSKIFKHSGCYRETSYPFISGDTFRAMADHVYDETTLITDWSKKVQQISDGDIVFLKTDYLCDFFSLFTSISGRFILVTHNGDSSAPGRFKIFLWSDKLLGWFASNPDFEHPKLYPIPIGLANTYVSHGNMTIFMDALGKDVKPGANRNILVYINFSIGTNLMQRSRALSHFRNFTRNHLAKLRTPFYQYLDDLGNSRFVLSPPGNGLDCHRTWEAQLMGAIPIVLSSTLNSLFSGTPTIIVSTWEQVTEASLRAINNSLLTTHIPAALLAQYWHAQFLSVRQSLQSSSVIDRCMWVNCSRTASLRCEQ